MDNIKLCRFVFYTIASSFLICHSSDGQGLQNYPGKPGNFKGLSVSQIGESSADYPELLKEIKSIKQEYSSLNELLDSLEVDTMDSSKVDRTLMEVKSRITDQIEDQLNLLEKLDGEILPEIGEGNYILQALKQFYAQSASRIENFDSPEELKVYLDNAEENLKAFSNNHISQLGKDKLEEYLQKEAGNSLPSGSLDLYGHGLDQLDNVSNELKEELSDKAVETGQREITKHVGEQGNLKETLNYVATRSQGFNKDPRDLFSKVENQSFFGENELKDKPLKERCLFGITANSLDAFGEGINANLIIGYRLTQYLTMLTGPNWKKEWKPSEDLSKEGHGVQFSLQYQSKGRWLGQIAVEHNYVHARYPDIQSQKNNKGFSTYPMLGAGKVVGLTKKFKSIIMGLWDPLYTASARLHSSAFLLRVGLIYY